MPRVNSVFRHEDAVEACYQYVLGRQTREGGFSLTPDSTASCLEIRRAGMKVLDYFHASPRNSSLIRSYVAGCQPALGGFGRTLGAIDGPSESVCAMEILSMLQDFSRGRKGSDSVQI